MTVWRSAISCVPFHCLPPWGKEIQWKFWVNRLNLLNTLFSQRCLTRTVQMCNQLSVLCITRIPHCVLMLQSSWTNKAESMLAFWLIPSNFIIKPSWLVRQYCHSAFRKRWIVFFFRNILYGLKEENMHSNNHVCSVSTLILCSRHWSSCFLKQMSCEWKTCSSQTRSAVTYFLLGRLKIRFWFHNQGVFWIWRNIR